MKYTKKMRARPSFCVRVGLVVAVLTMATTHTFAQNPDEPLNNARVGVPTSFALGVQEYTTGYSVLSGSTTFTANPIVVRDAYDENGHLRQSILVEHLALNILSLVDVETNTGAEIISVYYSGSRVAPHQRGFGGFGRVAAGPGLYVGESIVEFALTGSVAYGFGYDFPNFSIGLFLEANLGLVFFDVDTGVYSGGGFGLYMTRRHDLARGRVRDIPADYDTDSESDSDSE